MLVFDGLEVRLALSVGGTPLNLPPTLFQPFDTPPQPGTLNVVQVDPAPGATLRQAPSVITVTFDRTIDPGSISSDLVLRVMGPDGQWVPWNGDGFNDGLTVSLTVDTTGTQLIADFGTLTDGVYQLSISGSSVLMGTDGSSIAMSPDGSDMPVEEFAINSHSVSLAGATDLGPISSTVTTVAGSLDFAANPTDVQLYKFEVPQGHFWSLGAEISAQRQGSSAQVGLSLFDANGNLVTTAVVGRPDAPLDPYFFDGVGPGTYYLGVSSKANVAGNPGAYNPANGSGGVPADSSLGGSFQLSVVATPSDVPLGVKTIVLDHADPTSPNVTGFTVQFNGAIDSRSIASHTGSPVMLVDASGQSWPITLVGYSESNATLSFILNQSVPAGRYSIVVPNGGVLDLAGHRPSATGKNDGLLGNITIPASPASQARNDFGTLLPTPASNGISRSLIVAPQGQSSTRFVVPVAGYYAFDLSSLGGQPSAVLIDANGQSHSLEVGVNSDVARTVVLLPAGVNQILFAPQAGRGSIVQATLRLKNSLADSVLDNGIGQGAALGLRLVSPAAISDSFTLLPAGNPGEASGNTGGYGPASFQVSTNESGSNGSINPGVGEASASSSNGGSFSTGEGSAIYALSVSSAVGAPTSGSAVASPVGPAVGNSAAALASNGAGIPQGLTSLLGGRRGTASDENHGASDGQNTDGQLSAEVLGSDISIDSLLADAKRNTREGEIVDQALRLEPLLAKLTVGSSIVRGMDLPVEEATPAPDGEALADSAPLPRNDIEAANMSSLGAGLVAVAVAHSHRRISQILSRFSRKLRPGLRLHPSLPTVAGPHRPRRG